MSTPIYTITSVPMLCSPRPIRLVQPAWILPDAAIPTDLPLPPSPTFSPSRSPSNPELQTPSPAQSNSSGHSSLMSEKSRTWPDVTFTRPSPWNPLQSAPPPEIAANYRDNNGKSSNTDMRNMQVVESEDEDLIMYEITLDDPSQHTPHIHTADPDQPSLACSWIIADAPPSETWSSPASQEPPCAADNSAHTSSPDLQSLRRTLASADFFCAKKVTAFFEDDGGPALDESIFCVGDDEDDDEEFASEHAQAKNKLSGVAPPPRGGEAYDIDAEIYELECLEAGLCGLKVTR